MLKAHVTAEQIELSEGLNPRLVANEIASAVAFGEGLPETFFDYSCVPQESRAEVHELTKNLKCAAGRHFAVIVEIGAGLLRAKKLLGHGNFLPWLQAEFRWSERTARNYMTLAEHLQGKTANFADLDQTTALALIAAPAEVRDPIMRRVEGGESVGREVVKAAIQISRTITPSSSPSSTFRRVFAEPPPTGEPPPRVLTNVDFLAASERSAAQEIARDLRDIVFQLRGCGNNADGVVERFDLPAREEARRGIEAVLRIEEALDRLDQE